VREPMLPPPIDEPRRALEQFIRLFGAVRNFLRVLNEIAVELLSGGAARDAVRARQFTSATVYIVS
jgi:hypothetical protein